MTPPTTDPLDCQGPLCTEAPAEPLDDGYTIEPPPRPSLDRLALLLHFDRDAERAIRQMDEATRRRLEDSTYGEGEHAEGAANLRIDLQTFRARVCGVSPQQYSDCLYGRKGSDGTVLKWLAAWQAYRWTDAEGDTRALPDVDVSGVLAAGGISTQLHAA